MAGCPSGSGGEGEVCGRVAMSPPLLSLLDFWPRSRWQGRALLSLGHHTQEISHSGCGGGDEGWSFPQYHLISSPRGSSGHQGSLLAPPLEEVGELAAGGGLFACKYENWPPASLVPLSFLFLESWCCQVPGPPAGPGDNRMVPARRNQGIMNSRESPACSGRELQVGTAQGKGIGPVPPALPLTLSEPQFSPLVFPAVWGPQVLWAGVRLDTLR